jgi:hypothetical protein
MIIVDTLDNNSRLLVKGADENEVKIDVTIDTIDGVAFVGDFVALEIAIRTMVAISSATFLGTIAARSTPIPSEPAATLGSKTTTLLTNGQIYDSGTVAIFEYSQVQTSIVSDKNGTIDIEFYEDALGTNLLRALSIPYFSANGFETFSTICFTDYVKYKFTCTEVGQSLFFYETKLFKTSLSPQLVDLKSTIAGGMLSQLNRSVLVGLEGDGNYANVTVVETSNDAGVYHSLQVVNGARPSQVFGRTAVSIVPDEVTASALLRATTANKTFYATDIILTIDNSGSVPGTLKLRNGIIAAQPVVACFMVADPPGAASSDTVVTASFQEPIQFDTGVWLDIAAGTLIICGVINGYEE